MLIQPDQLNLLYNEILQRCLDPASRLQIYIASNDCDALCAAYILTVRTLSRPSPPLPLTLFSLFSSPTCSTC